VAVLLALVQTKQEYIYINETIQETQYKNTKHSKYKYTHYQNTHTLQNPHITKQFTTTTVQIKTNTVQDTHQIK